MGAVSFCDIYQGKRLYILVKTWEFIALFFTLFFPLFNTIYIIFIMSLYHEHCYLEIIYWSDLDLGVIHMHLIMFIASLSESYEWSVALQISIWFRILYFVQSLQVKLYICGLSVKTNLWDISS